MIRGPVIPLTRDGLWRLLEQRPEVVERGLRVVAEALEFGRLEAAYVDGLLRDASGAPVLVFVADDREGALPARVLGAHSFWQRHASGILRALPEAALLDAGRCRLLVVGACLPADLVALLTRLAVPELEILEIDTILVGGQERLVVRSLLAPAAPTAGPVPLDPSIGAAAVALLAAFESLASALDPRVRIDGDRFSRRASFDGRTLAECWFAAGAVHGAVDGDQGRVLQGAADVRALGDRIARRYLASIGVVVGGAAAAAAGAAMAPVPAVSAASEGAGAGARTGFEALRASVTASRLSREECSALGDSNVGEPEEESLADS